MREMNWPPRMAFIASIAISSGLAFGGATWPARMSDCSAPGRSMT